MLAQNVIFTHKTSTQKQNTPRVNHHEFHKSFFSAGIVLLSTLWSRPLSAQWNSYDAMMSNNVYSRGWVNPYDNTYTNMYQSYSYTPTYNTYTYFGSGSRAIRAARRSAYLKKMPPRQRTEAQSSPNITVRCISRRQRWTQRAKSRRFSPEAPVPTRDKPRP
jgi:hypothetical protein